MAGGSSVEALSLDDLRHQRISARRAAEFEHLRARQGDGTTAPELARLDARVRELTDELIRRYAADLSLVDSLLDRAYPADGTRDGRGGR